jgi:uncharacterized protein
MNTNRLATEKSPYLRQHAHNPVDWWPWGPEAFQKARAEDKPIFLSIGYSTCHWCHVMERESFENEEVASVLNAHFVPIKVDREERPDVDRIYMLFVQATTGGGGWPMSVWLTPELKPFFGGTYFPPDNRYGRPGFRAILEQIAQVWARDRQKIEQSSIEVTNQLEQHASLTSHPSAIDAGIADSAFHAFRRSFDIKLGGFGGAPKFPRPAALNFLLRYYVKSHNDEALDMVKLTLSEMAKGGMYDQIGGGFHRYSVDDRWFVPHFEKMLYDQAQLAASYLETFQITRDQTFAAVARDIFSYVQRDMTHPEGGFYSAEDADSVIDPAQPNIKGEGAFYIWTWQELEAALGSDLLDRFAKHFGVERDGNVHEDPHGEFTGRNILYAAKPVLSDTEIQEARRRLLDARSRRVRPHLDDKILTSWNALMISAFAKGAQVLGEQRYADAALRAAEFVLKHLYDPGTATLLRRYREGDSAIPGFLDDYAFFIQALLDLYETGFNTYHLELAMQLAERMRELFEDTEHGGFFGTAEGDSNLILRIKEDYDGAEPSGNSMATLALLRLARLTGRSDFGNAAERALLAFAQRITSSPTGVPQMLVALLYSLSPPRQIVIAGEKTASSQLLGVIREHFLPDTTVMLLDKDEARETLAAHSPELRNMREVDGIAAAYVCENFACKLPVTEGVELAELLK